MKSAISLADFRECKILPISSPFIFWRFTRSGRTTHN